MSKFSGKPLLAVPLGDAAGIGPEIVAKLCANGFLMEHARPILVGDESVLRRGMESTGTDFSYRVAETMEAAVEAALEETAPVLLHTHSLDAAQVKVSEVSAVNGKEAVSYTHLGTGVRLGRARSTSAAPAVSCRQRMETRSQKLRISRMLPGQS